MNTAAFLAQLTPSADVRHPAWLHALRRAALQWVTDQGFPTAKDEAWKHTRVAPILEVPFQPARPGASRDLSATSVERLAGDYGSVRLVFVNGYFAAELSVLEGLPPGTQVCPFATLLSADNGVLESLFAHAFRSQPQAFPALNAALAEDGAWVQIPAHTTVEAPIHLVFLSAPGVTPQVAHPRVLVRVGAGSRAIVVESHVGSGDEVYLSNAVSEVVLDADAVLEYYTVQNESTAAFHVALLSVRQAQGSHFASHSFALGATLARQEVRVVLEGPGAEVALNGLYLPQGQQHLDNQTTIEHLAPRCTSRELYKGVIDDRGHAVFDGRIIVRPGAMKTDASQTNKNLLLATSAQVNTQPRLEIFADDVKCAHGAAVGQLDEQAIFYLRSRGIALAAARSVLIFAFVSEMLELIRLEPLREQVERRVAAQLRGREVSA
ncbi:Fe-S cluster assembly protein SufD [Pseudomonas frederiksbergensis]|uniref:Fe-S cluster assembly protein SufD n=1 Tax=Pseudomonas frederiksbergensis TaxID=104087 RepID=A0A1J0ESD1_9PSED|nr:Fe-S cluster assembly protein SufD [Pseudomonas frederiksbergensis]APC19077.1 Fe-S cluster assembly protein SufD [Pseudomonas frederiksbergensis]